MSSLRSIYIRSFLITFVQYFFGLPLSLSTLVTTNRSHLLIGSFALLVFTCLNYQNLASLMLASIQVIPTVSWISLFPILSLLVCPHIHLNDFHSLNMRFPNQITLCPIKITNLWSWKKLYHHISINIWLLLVICAIIFNFVVLIKNKIDKVSFVSEAKRSAITWKTCTLVVIYYGIMNKFTFY